MTTPFTIPACGVTPQALNLLSGIHAVFRSASDNPMTCLLPEVASQEAREKLGAVLDQYRLTDAEKNLLAYPLRVSRRLIAGEDYGPARFRALERHLWGRANYFRGVMDSGFQIAPLVEAGLGATHPSPPPTMPSSGLSTYDACRERIQGLEGAVAFVPEELQFLDLTGTEIRKARVKGSFVAGRVVPLPMVDVYDRIFSREFDIGKNEGSVPGFWAEKVTVIPSPSPSVLIRCRMEAIDDLQVFMIAAREMLGLRNPIEVLLEGCFEWREEALYIPMKPVRITGDILRADALFGAVTPILIPIGPHETVFALDMEDKLFSQNPEIFVERMVAGLLGS